MVDVSILIVCYNSRELIEQCITGIFEHTNGCTFEVLLLDCSNDGTIDLVRSKFPQVQIVDNHDNLGFARSNNRLAAEARGRHLLLLNPDTIVTDNAIGELYATAQNFPDAGAVGGRSLRRDGSRDPGCRQITPSISRLLIAALGGARLLNGAIAEDATEPSDAETLSGAFMMVRADAWREVGGFDPDYFMYAEELDLCFRLRRRGYRIIMTPRAEIVHLVGSGESLSPRRVTLLTKARMHFLRKFWTPPRATIGGAILWMHGAIRLLGGSVGGALIGRQRATLLRESYADVVFRPRSWWYGFQERTQS